MARLSRTWRVARGLAMTQVLDGSSKLLDVVTEKSEASVAFVAQQPSNASGRMAMIHDQPRRLLFAEQAPLLLAVGHCSEFFQRHAVLMFQVPAEQRDAALWAGVIATLPFEAFLVILHAIARSLAPQGFCRIVQAPLTFLCSMTGLASRSASVLAVRLLHELIERLCVSAHSACERRRRLFECGHGDPILVCGGEWREC
jgi:hypothetical protein